jgi:hypothetical protein
MAHHSTHGSRKWIDAPGLLAQAPSIDRIDVLGTKPR